jgi:hypothetical protein
MCDGEELGALHRTRMRQHLGHQRVPATSCMQPARSFLISPTPLPLFASLFWGARRAFGPAFPPAPF